MVHSTWTLRPLTHTPSRVYERPLGFTELSFYYDSLLSGTSDTTRHIIVQAQDAQGLELFTKENVLRAWISVKQDFPLLGSHIELDQEGKGARFVIVEEDLRSCNPSEVHFLNIGLPSVAEEFVRELLHGKRCLDSATLAQVYILRRLDMPNHFHVVLHVAHAITDGMGNIALAKRFLDGLCMSKPTPALDLQARLALASASEDLDPSLRLNVQCQRWKRVISEVIRTIRWAKLKGGHTLPQIRHPSNSQVLPKSYLTRISLPEELSSRIIATCRKQSLTFGQAYAVLAQVALARVLCRRYLQGKMSKEEWEDRKRQPMHTGGPLNLRPYLDKEWLDDGGATNVCCAIGFFWYTLPFMPLGSASRLAIGDELPSFDALLSRGRFFFRSNLIKKQSAHVFGHPLFVGIAKEQARQRIEKVREVARNFESTNGEVTPFKSPFVLSFAGSSMGNVERLEQYDFPSIRPNQTDVRHQAPLLRIISTDSHLRCRPGELYLGSATSRKELHMYVFWDGSSYEETMVKEWLNEVKEAALWYLGQENNRQNLGKL